MYCNLWRSFQKYLWIFAWGNVTREIRLEISEGALKEFLEESFWETLQSNYKIEALQIEFLKELWRNSRRNFGRSLWKNPLRNFWKISELCQDEIFESLGEFNLWIILWRNFLREISWEVPERFSRGIPREFLEESLEEPWRNLYGKPWKNSWLNLWRKKSENSLHVSLEELVENIWIISWWNLWRNSSRKHWSTLTDFQKYLWITSWPCFPRENPWEIPNKLLEKFLRESMDQFLKKSPLDYHEESLVEFFVKEIPGGIPSEILDKFSDLSCRNP